MDLMEYKAHEMFAASGISVFPSVTVSSLEELERQMASISFPAVAKAQVQTGGRGKAGGVILVSTPDELREACAKILRLTIKGLPVRRVMVVRQANITKEYYMSIVLDRNTKGHKLIFSAAGGMDIEEAARTRPESVVKLEIRPNIGLLKPAVRYAAKKAGADPMHWPAIEAAAEGLYRCAYQYDCMLAEINPLAACVDGSLMALDAKAVVDDSALYRHPELLSWRDEVEENALILEARKSGFLYIPCEPDGTVVVMSNGSGLLMSCIDLLAKRGLKTLAVLDLGGGATAARVKEAIRILAASPGAKILFINIFGGITRCDEIAGGIEAALSQYGLSLPVVTRFEGTNKQLGLEILQSLAQVAYVEGLAAGVEAVYERSGRA